MQKYNLGYEVPFTACDFEGLAVDHDDKDLFEALNGVFGLFALTTFEYGYALSVKDGAQMNSCCLVIPPGKHTPRTQACRCGCAPAGCPARMCLALTHLNSE